MKKSIFSQVLIIIFLWLAFSGVEIIRYHQNRRFSQQISNISFNVASEKKIEQIKEKIEKLDFIQSITLKDKKEIYDELVNEFNLKSSSLFLKPEQLPEILIILTTEGLFGENELKQLKGTIEETDEKAFIKFDEESFVDLLSEQSKTNLYIDYVLLGSAVFFIIFTMIMRRYFETKSDGFWLIYRKSGGSPKMRKKKIIKSSFLLMFLPIILLVSVYYGLFYFKYIDSVLSDRFLILLVFSNCFAQLVSTFILVPKMKCLEN
ncbi:MAG: permease-like cell division protein FtsX [Candidatus Cloacimonetes bacterium]|nr:permease-like cell division protein FtsX [Candidatus Cloacimonadota bacterium]